MNKAYVGSVGGTGSADAPMRAIPMAPTPATTETLMQVLGECLSLTLGIDEHVDSLKAKLFGEYPTNEATEATTQRADVEYVAHVLRKRLYAVRDQAEYLNRRVQ